MSHTQTYRLGGTPASPVQFLVPIPSSIPTARFARVSYVDVRTVAPLTDPYTFVRVHVTCPESMTDEMPLPAAPVPPPPPPPVPLPPFTTDPPVPMIGNYAYPYPNQPLVVYDASSSFDPTGRATIDLTTLPSIPPMGPIRYTYFPYVINIIAPVAISVRVTITYA